VDTRTLCTHSSCSHTDINCVRNLTFWSVLFKVCHLHNTKVYLYESTSYCLKQTSLCATKIFISIRVCSFYCKFFLGISLFPDNVIYNKTKQTKLCTKLLQNKNNCKGRQISTKCVKAEQENRQFLSIIYSKHFYQILPDS